MRSVLITGASSGIGRACALDLDSRGWRVFAGFRSDGDDEELLEASSGNLEPVRIDVTDSAEIAAAGATIAEEVGLTGLDGLVNNAGIAVGGPLEFMPIDDLRRQLEVNFVGHIAVTQEMLPLLRRAPGRIVNVTSMGGRLAAPFFGPYSGSKFALEAATDTLRRELHDFGIWVAAVEPGSIDTPIWDRGIETGSEIVKRMDPAVHDVYGDKLRRFRELARRTGERGIDVRHVSEAIRQALESGRPRARYVVGNRTRLQLTAQSLLPTRLFDALIRRSTGL